MTDSICLEATVRMWHIEVGDETIHRKLDGTLTQDELDMIALQAVTLSNFMELGVSGTKVISDD